MKLESLDEMEEEQRFFCASCGKQLQVSEDISQRVCFSCRRLLQQRNQDDIFFCWACGKHLQQMGEVAQGLCHACKTSIIRKIQKPLKSTGGSIDMK